MTEAHFDELLTRLGTGKWNFIFFTGMFIWGMMVPFHFLEGVFVAPIVPHECVDYTVVASPTHNLTHYSLAHLQVLGSVHNVTKEEVKCSVDVAGFPREAEGDVETYHCSAWTYETNTTMTSEFDLVCDRAYLTATYQSSFQLGSLIGCIFNGILTDRLGRRTMMWGSSVMFITLSIASTWITSFNAIVNVRLLIGIMEGPLIQTNFSLCMEVCEPRLRSVMGIILAVPWALGTMAWGALAYLIRDWRWLQLAISLPTLIALPVLWLYDESPRWLIVRGRHRQAKKTLQRAARLNGASLPSDDELNYLMVQIQQETDSTTTSVRGFRQRLSQFSDAVLVLFRTSNIRRIMLVLFLDFYVASFVFFGLSLNGSNYSDNLYLYMVFSGVAEVFSYTLAVPLVVKFGRRLPVTWLYFLSAVSILALAFIPSQLMWLVMILAQLGKFSISAAYQIIYLYASELIPTNVRLQGFASAALIGKIGNIMAPFVLQYLDPVYPLAPSILFCLASTAAGLATMLLPETLGADLPDTIADLEHGLCRKTTKGRRRKSRGDVKGAGEEGESFNDLQRT